MPRSPSRPGRFSHRQLTMQWHRSSLGALSAAAPGASTGRFIVCEKGMQLPAARRTRIAASGKLAALARVLLLLSSVSTAGHAAAAAATACSTPASAELRKDSFTPAKSTKNAPARQLPRQPTGCQEASREWSPLAGLDFCYAFSARPQPRGRRLRFLPHRKSRSESHRWRRHWRPGTLWVDAAADSLPPSNRSSHAARRQIAADGPETDCGTPRRAGWPSLAFLRWIMLSIAATRLCHANVGRPFRCWPLPCLRERESAAATRNSHPIITQQEGKQQRRTCSDACEKLDTPKRLLGVKLRRRTGFRGVRVGEASNPGPRTGRCTACLVNGADIDAVPGTNLCRTHARVGTGGGRGLLAGADGDVPLAQKTLSCTSPKWRLRLPEPASFAGTTPTATCQVLPRFRPRSRPAALTRRETACQGARMPR